MGNTKDSFGKRMKEFELSHKLNDDLPIIIRLDGKAFHTLTKKCMKPFDDTVMSAMQRTMFYLCENIQGCSLGYTQSDEISLLLINYHNEKSEGWFNNAIQKMVSVSASMAGAKFSTIWGKIAIFDSRCFNISKEEAANIFIWRQQDCIRNSIQMFARSIYSHKECNNKNCDQLQAICLEKGFSWDELSSDKKFGTCAVKTKKMINAVDYKTGNDIVAERNIWELEDAPLFSKNREYVEKHL